MNLERQALAEIATSLPGQPVSYGIDHKGPWARIGGITARARRPAAALRAALQQALGVA